MLTKKIFSPGCFVAGPLIQYALFADVPSVESAFIPETINVAPAALKVDRDIAADRNVVDRVKAKALNWKLMDFIRFRPPVAVDIGDDSYYVVADTESALIAMAHPAITLVPIRIISLEVLERLGCNVSELFALQDKRRPSNFVSVHAM